MTNIVKPLACSLGLLMVAAAPLASAAPSKPAPKAAKTSKATKTSKTVKSTATADSAAPVISTSATGSVLVPVLTEPTLGTVSYPKVNSVQWIGTDLSSQHLSNVALPALSISQLATLPTVLIPQTTANNAQLDVSVLDDFITFASPKARHYPPVFNSRTERYNATERLKQLTAWIETYAKDNNASYDVLLRAAKLNAMGRNLDLGSDYAVRAGNYIARAIKLKDTAEANFLYGAMLAEGGGFKEGTKYLEKAESMGYLEATQSLAQADLLDDKKDRALQRLNDFKAKNPNNPYIDEQLRIVNSGKYYIWDIPADAVMP